jgi:DNA-binding HxlR family transcriptional regulator
MKKKAVMKRESAPRRQGRGAPEIVSLAPTDPVASMIENVVGCKWSMHVLGLVRRGVNRPGAMERAVPGLTAKVLGQRLDKFLRYGVLERVQYPEIPPRVEYRFTVFGMKFLSLVDAVGALQEDVASASSTRSE